MLPTPDDIKMYITSGMLCEHVEVEGDGQHFYATIISSTFIGKNRVERHQVVYTALGARMKSEIHALSMKTFSPEEWRASVHA
jgi:acid stress-induced BolA-like protein IbaG/YrbA